MSRVTISKTSDNLFRAVVTEKHSMPWYYGENAAQALRGAPVEIRAHAARVEALLARPGTAEVVIKDRGSHVEVECVYGQYRRVIPSVSTDIGEAIDRIIRELEEKNE